MSVKKIKFDDTWKYWISHNINRGVSKEDIFKILLEHNYDCETIIGELGYNLKCKSNNINTQTNLQKIIWMSSVKSDLMLHSNNLIVELTEAPTWDYFLKNFYALNKPVIIRNTINKKYEEINIDFLYNKYENFKVEIQKGRNSIKNYEIESNKLKEKIGFKDFIKLIKINTDNDIYLTANNNKNKNIEKIKTDILDMIVDNSPPWSYLTNKFNDKSFIWVGPKNSKTPYHHDLTNNLFIQIYGKKEFTLIPSIYINKMYNNHHVFSDVPSFDYDENELDKYPEYRKINPINITVNPGDILFIPIGWWHKVKGLSETIGLSFINFKAKNNYNLSYPV